MQMDPTTSTSPHFSTLISTMLESNALLREEIDQMEESECTAFKVVVYRDCALGQGRVRGRDKGRMVGKTAASNCFLTCRCW